MAEPAAPPAPRGRILRLPPRQPGRPPHRRDRGGEHPTQHPETPPWGAPVIFFLIIIFDFGLFLPPTPGAGGTGGEQGGGGQPPAAFAAHPVRGHAPAPRLPCRGPAPGCVTGTGDTGDTGCPRTHLSSLPGAEEPTRSHLPSVLPAGGKRGFVAAAVRASFAGRTVGGGEHPWVLAVGGG